MATIDEQFQKDLNNRMDYLIQLVLKLNKRIDNFIDDFKMDKLREEALKE